MTANLATSTSRSGWIGRRMASLGDRPGIRRLEVVATSAQRRARPRITYAIVGVGIILAIVAAQLTLSIMVSQGAYQLNSLQTTTKSLQRTAQVASEDLNRVSSPQYLAASANALGMIENSNPVYLRLSDGAVLGSPNATAAGPFTATSGNLVPNSLLSGIPLVTAKQPTSATHTPAAKSSTPGAAAGSGATGASAATTSAQAANSGSTSAPGSTNPAPTVPLGGALPTPETH